MPLSKEDQHTLAFSHRAAQDPSGRSGRTQARPATLPDICGTPLIRCGNWANRLPGPNVPEDPELIAGGLSRPAPSEGDVDGRHRGEAQCNSQLMRDGPPLPRRPFQEKEGTGRIGRANQRDRGKSLCNPPGVPGTRRTGRRSCADRFCPRPGRESPTTIAWLGSMPPRREKAAAKMSGWGFDLSA
jgi:hypothetical protein